MRSPQFVAHLSLDSGLNSTQRLSMPHPTAPNPLFAAPFFDVYSESVSHNDKPRIVTSHFLSAVSPEPLPPPGMVAGATHTVFPTHDTRAPPDRPRPSA